MSKLDSFLNIVEYIFDHDRYKEKKMKKLVKSLRKEGSYEVPDVPYNIQ